MANTESNSNTNPEKPHFKGSVGKTLVVTILGERDVPPPGPGMIAMEEYDATYLTVEQCGWFPAGEAAPSSTAFQVAFMPLKAGQTEVNFNAQPRAINPLFTPITATITITE